MLRTEFQEMLSAQVQSGGAGGEGLDGGTEADGARRLTEKEKLACRGLWEEVFTEDSQEFLDYYDRWKYEGNECYGIYHGDRLVSMLQMNPYEMQLQPLKSGQPQRVESRYIVAVATREEYRHRGLMRRLLKKSLSDMQNQRIPFVFLMPAAEAIYRPFGFRYFYEMNTGTLEIKNGQSELETGRKLDVGQAEASDIVKLVDFAEKIQMEFFDCYVRKDCFYYKRLLEELKSEDGALLVLTEGERLVAVVPYWGKSPIEIRELLCRPGDREQVFAALGRWFGERQEGGGKGVLVEGASIPLEEKKPAIMGRIVDVISFLEMFSAERPVELVLEISDEILEENSGCYRWSLSPQGSVARRQEEFLQAAEAAGQDGKGLFQAAGRDGKGRERRVRCTVAELFSCLMGAAEPKGALRMVRGCWRVYINEIV